MPLKLYAHLFSAYCQKVLIALYEKDAAFEMALLSSENPSAGAELGALWPLERFPILRADGQTIVESSVIIEWLDLHCPSDARMIPLDPDAALDVRMRDRVFDSYVMTPVQSIVFDRARPEELRDPHGVGHARGLLDRAYRWLDGEMASREWAAGAAFGMADCAAAPALFYADWVHPLDGHTHLAAYLKRLHARPSFRRAVDEARPYRHLFPGGAPPGRD